MGNIFPSGCVYKYVIEPYGMLDKCNAATSRIEKDIFWQSYDICNFGLSVQDCMEFLGEVF